MIFYDPLFVLILTICNNKNQKNQNKSQIFYSKFLKSMKHTVCVMYAERELFCMVFLNIYNYINIQHRHQSLSLVPVFGSQSCLYIQ